MTKARRALLGIAKERSSLSARQVGKLIIKPNWQEGKRVDDWRNFVDLCFQEIWDNLSEESKLLVFSFAWDQAEFCHARA